MSNLVTQYTSTWNRRQLSSDVLSSRDGQLGFVTLNRPHMHNAISVEMWKAIPNRMSKLVAAGSSVIILRGEGESFASGADLEELRNINRAEDAEAIWHNIFACLEYVWSCEVPVVASIHGACIGGGCLLAAACDFRIATTSSKFAIPIARLGLLLDDRTIGRLVTSAGAPLAKELLITGEAIDAQRAYDCGFLNRLAAPDRLYESVSEFAGRIARNVVSTVRICKRSVNAFSGLLPTSEKISDEQVIQSYLSAEFRSRIRQVTT